jgi:hypothetical protein
MVTFLMEGYCKFMVNEMPMLLLVQNDLKFYGKTITSIDTIFFKKRQLIRKSILFFQKYIFDS